MVNPSITSPQSHKRPGVYFLSSRLFYTISFLTTLLLAPTVFGQVSIEFNNGIQGVIAAENVGTRNVSIDRVGGTLAPVEVFFSTTNVNATSPEDYISTTGSIQFAQNQTTATIPVQIIDDQLFEGVETLNLFITNVVGPEVYAPVGNYLRIDDDDLIPSLSFATATVTANESASAATIKVIRSGAIDNVVSVAYSTSEGTANAGDDYSSVSGTLSFAAGQTSAIVTVPIRNDGLQESPGNETFTVTLSNPIVAELGVNTLATVEIVDSSSSPMLEFDAEQVTVDEGAGTLMLTVNRSGAINAVSVDYAASNGSATTPDDYTGVWGRLTFAVGQNTAIIAVPITDDLKPEPFSETFTVTLSNPFNGAKLGANKVQVTISDDDVALSPPTKETATSDGSPSSALFKGGVIADNGNSFGDTFSVGESIVIPVTIIPEPDQVGSIAEIFVLASDGSNFVQLTSSGLLSFDGTLEGLIPFTQILLDDMNDIDLLEATGGPYTLTSAEVGSWNLFVGYSTGDGVITFTATAIAFEVIE